MALNDLLKTFNEEKVVVKEEKRYVEKSKEGISLKGVLQRGRLKLSKEKQPYPQSLTFSPSTITYGYCKRLKVAQLAGLATLYHERTTPRLQLTFDLGNAIHDIIQGYFWDLGMLKGSYKCIKCEKTYDEVVAPETCPSGKKTHKRSALQYKEITLEDKRHLIKGRCDGILVIDGEEHLMDIKSIHNRVQSNQIGWCFEDLEEKGPKPDHVVQLNLYMWMSGVHNGHLLYVAKNNPQIKTFAIPYDTKVIEPYLTEIRKMITTAENLKAGHSVILPKPCGNEKCSCHKVLGISKE